MSNNSIAVTIGAAVSGSVGSPTVDKQVSQIVKPLRVVVEEVRALKEMGKDFINKDEAAVRRLLNALHRVFTLGAIGNNYGAFWDFLVVAAEEMERQHGTFSDRLARDLTNAKDKMTSRVRLPSTFGTDDTSSTRFTSSSTRLTRQSTGVGSSAPAFGSGLSNAHGFPLPNPTAEKALVKSIEYVKGYNMSNKLNCLHLWIIYALQQGQVLSSALTCAVVPMCDILQAYIGIESPFYAKQSAMAIAASAAADAEDGHTGDNGSATLCYPFLIELLKVFEELQEHPDLGPIKYNLDITSMQLFQTVTNKNGQIIVGVNGADNTEQLEYYLPNMLHKGKGRRKGGHSRKQYQSVATDTEGLGSGSNATVLANERENSIVIFQSPSESSIRDLAPFQKPTEDTRPKAKPLNDVLTFTELCEMQNDLLEQQKKIKSKEDALADREAEILQREQEAKDASSQIVEVVLKIKELYWRITDEMREKQQMGHKFTVKDINRKIPQLLQVLDDGDFDMVADEDELNAAALAKNSQNRFRSDTVHSPTVFGGSNGDAISQNAVGLKPLVIDDPNDGIPPHKVAGLIPLRTTEPVEKERNDQLRSQNFLCGDCGTAFGGEGTHNVLLKTFQKTSEILTMQKPRRCHYCTQLLCHNCHTNQTALLPFRVIPKWDFSNKHVCKRCYTFLAQNYNLAHYDFRKIPREITSSPVLQQCATLRKYLMRAALIISGCTRPSSAVFAQDLHTHYFQKEYFYSMHDLQLLFTTEKRESNPANIVPGMSNMVGAVQWMAGVNVANLLEMLSAKLVGCKKHIAIDCSNCKTRASMPCAICNLINPVFVIDEDGTQCRKCRSIYHVKCLEQKGCPVCADNNKH